MNCFRCVQSRQPTTVASVMSPVMTPFGPPSEAVCYLHVETSPTKLKPMCRECMDQFMRTYNSHQIWSKRGPAYELPLENWEDALAVAQVHES